MSTFIEMPSYSNDIHNLVSFPFILPLSATPILNVSNRNAGGHVFSVLFCSVLLPLLFASKPHEKLINTDHRVCHIHSSVTNNVHFDVNWKMYSTNFWHANGFFSMKKMDVNTTCFEHSNSAIIIQTSTYYIYFSSSK